MRERSLAAFQHPSPSSQTSLHLYISPFVDGVALSLSLLLILSLSQLISGGKDALIGSNPTCSC